MNHRSSHCRPSHGKAGGRGRWVSFVLGLVLAIIGLLLVSERVGGSARLLDHITTLIAAF